MIKHVNRRYKPSISECSSLRTSLSQISANGKTTSLGDHDTEELAATAFDRAAIHRAGQKAKTNFPIARYADEIEDLEGNSRTA